VLRDAMLARVRDDVQRRFGMDSMLSPTSVEKTTRLARAEIELYLIAASTAAVHQRGYLAPDDAWYLSWLGRLRLGEFADDHRATRRLSYYLAQAPDRRRLSFTNVLAGVLPESRKAPLVLFQLAPLAVEIVTAQAFGDAAAATEARAQQTAYLPAIRDCHECRGQLLENSASCPGCGNPLWKFEWLVAVD
jgi:hypothetical protein